MRLEGIDAELMTLGRDRPQVPGPRLSAAARFPVVGGLMQRRAGTARHDAVAWGFARGADRLGVDIIENCEVTGFLSDGDRIVGVDDPRGEIRAPKVGVAVAGIPAEVMRMAGIDRLPIESHVLQAFVTESLKPLIDTVVTFGVGHLYVSQSDKGGLVYGGNLDDYNSYAQRGNLPIVRGSDGRAAGAVSRASRGCGCCAPGAALIDMSMDGCPIITTGPLPGMYLNCGWCYGGFKATPASGWCFAHTIANDEPHPLNAPSRSSASSAASVIDDKGQGATPACISETTC